MSATSVEEFRKHLKTYWLVFFGLLVLTAVTVGISYLHLPVLWAVVVAMIVASIKASLVAAFFMHLNAEKAIIYATLLITIVKFLFLMLIPVFIYMHV